jgi:hypothetical protein
MLSSRIGFLTYLGAYTLKKIKGIGFHTYLVAYTLKMIKGRCLICNNTKWMIFIIPNNACFSWNVLIAQIVQPGNLHTR